MDSDSLGLRLKAIETRLTRIEETLKLAPAAVVAPAAPKPAATLPPRAKPEFKPGNWLGVIAVICFVLAAGFIVKLSIESGWLTPARQIGLAGLLGFALIATGLALLRADRAYASLLPGGGVVVLYLTTFAAHRLYGLIGFEPAILITGCVSGVCVFLYTEIKHEAYAITAAVGAYVSPVILGLGTAEVFSLYYFVICSVAFATISIWLRSRVLILISAYLALFMSGAIAIGISGQEKLLASLLALQFVIFTTGTVAYTVLHKTPMREAEAWAALPVLTLFYAFEYFLLDGITPSLAPWISLGFAGLLVALYFGARRLIAEGLSSQSLIMAFATIVVFHSGYLVLWPDDYKPYLLAPIVLGLAFVPGELRWGSHWRPGIIPAIALLIVAAIGYVTIVTDLAEDRSATVAAGMLGFLAMWAALAFAPKLRQRTANGHLLLGAAHVLAVLGSYYLTHDISSLAVSASWLFYAVAVLAFAYIRKDKVMAQSALFVLGFAAGKALLFDAANAPTVVRIFCLLLTGVVLYGCGLFMRRVNDWGKETLAQLPA
ncbi:MAG TPA: DUF2339 domain-containing protein [Rhizomicrobium sp.]|jgi:uncharacterized membrane protein